MSLRFKFKAASLPVIPDGTHEATFLKVEDVKTEEYGDRRQWHFNVQDGGKTVTLTLWSSRSDSLKSKQREILTAILGTSPQVEEEIREEDLIGKPVQIVTKTRTLADGRKVSNIVTVLAPKAPF